MNREAFLHFPFEQLDRQHQAVSFGMWIFLASEVLLFGALFAGYAVYRLIYAQAFVDAARQTNVLYGTLNTAILMTSSFTIALAGRTAQARFYRVARHLLVITFCLGAIFLAIKGIEYRDDLVKGLVPRPNLAAGAQQFFSLYWIMTGIHAIHVTAGLIAVLRLIVLSGREGRWLGGSASDTATALYWHLVDVIWIILYPLLYLTGRTHG